MIVLIGWRGYFAIDVFADPLYERDVHGRPYCRRRNSQRRPGVGLEVRKLIPGKHAEGSVVEDKTETPDVDPRGVLAGPAITLISISRFSAKRPSKEIFVKTRSSASTVMVFSLKWWRSFGTEQPTGEVAIPTW